MSLGRPRKTTTPASDSREYRPEFTCIVALTPLIRVAQAAWVIFVETRIIFAAGETTPTQPGCPVRHQGTEPLANRSLDKTGTSGPGGCRQAARRGALRAGGGRTDALVGRENSRGKTDGQQSQADWGPALRSDRAVASSIGGKTVSCFMVWRAGRMAVIDDDSYRCYASRDG